MLKKIGAIAALALTAMLAIPAAVAATVVQTAAAATAPAPVAAPDVAPPAATAERPATTDRAPCAKELRYVYSNTGSTHAISPDSSCTCGCEHFSDPHHTVCERCFPNCWL